MGILYHHDRVHKYKAIFDFAKKLKNLGKQVVGLSYILGSVYLPKGFFPALKPQNISAWGTIRDLRAKYFINKVLYKYPI